jgi:hypothetical protein
VAARLSIDSSVIDRPQGGQEPDAFDLLLAPDHGLERPGNRVGFGSNAESLPRAVEEILIEQEGLLPAAAWFR